ncbi:MAG: PKD domain-containing protein, partial [Candidatus ainarchaeum sp.]|nr:PKD domain-containing protein [Candidatus ainarchaeum sp.]
MKERFGIAIFLIILLAGIISATYSVKNSYIDTIYGPGDSLKGTIEMSFAKEPLDSEFKSSIGDVTTTATLLKVLRGNSAFKYSCNPASCNSTYDAISGLASKSLNLDAEQASLIGFKISSQKLVTDFSGFSVDFTSDAVASWTPQITIDVLNNDKIWQPHTTTENFGEKNYGCYSEGNQMASVITTEYCGKVNLSQSPAIQLGANLVGSGEATIVMSIETVNEEEYSYGGCEISVSGSGEVICIPENFSITQEQNFFVCIKAKSANDSGKYQINSEANSPCGFAGSFENSYDRDFEIFARQGEYSAIGSFTLDSTEILDINNEIENYVEGTYENNCSSGCVVPIKITAEIPQKIDASNAVLKYSTGGIALTAELLYDLEETAATATASLQNMSIDSGGFKVPSDYDDYEFSLSFNEKEIFSDEISVEPIPTIKYLTPRTTAMNYPTEFKVKVSSNDSIKSYEWNFGDNSKENTTTNVVTHTYDNMGSYNLSVKIMDDSNRSTSKVFSINVGSASEITPLLITEMRTNIEAIRTQIKNFTAFERNALDTALNLDSIEATLNTAEIANENANTEEDYQKILEDLLKISLPQTIYLGTLADSIMFFPKAKSIDVSLLTNITGEEYSSAKKTTYANAIRGWIVQNVDITLSHREIVGSFETEEDSLVKTFDIEVTKKAGCEDDPYIVLKTIDGLNFASDYSEERKDGYVYFPLIGESKRIIFSTTEELEFLDLPLFVSPKINKLSVVDSNISPFDDSGNLKKWVIFSLIMILLIIVGAIFWGVLNIWYKKKYENYLFKNKTNLYNLFMWIENSKRKGIKEEEIRRQLKKA